MTFVAELHGVGICTFCDAHDRARRQNHAVLPIVGSLVPARRNLLHHEKRANGDLAGAGHLEAVFRQDPPTGILPAFSNLP